MKQTDFNSIYSKNLDIIKGINIQMLKKTSLIAMGFYGLMVLSTIFMKWLSFLLVVYIPATVVFGGIFIYTMLQNENILMKHITLLVRAFLFTNLLVSAILGTFGGIDKNATIFNVILVVAPLIVIDKPKVISWTVILWGATFSTVCLVIKPTPIASIDAVNTLMCVFLSIFVYNMMFAIKLRDIDSTAILKIQRNIDVTTGLNNRRSLDDRLEKISETLTDDNNTCIILIDIDFFKKFNDTYGHIMGDQCLKTIGIFLSTFGKEHGISFFRYGGEEFVGISQDHCYNDFALFSKQIVKKLGELNIVNSESEFSRVTITVGYSDIKECKACTVEKAISYADQAMYHGKRHGKNQACGYLDLEIIDD